MPVASDQINRLSKLLSGCNHPVLIWAMTALALRSISNLPWEQSNLVLKLAPLLGTSVPWIPSLASRARKVFLECGWTYWHLNVWRCISFCLHCLKWGGISQDSRVVAFYCAAPSSDAAKRWWVFECYCPEVGDKVSGRDRRSKAHFVDPNLGHVWNEKSYNQNQTSPSITALCNRQSDLIMP